MGASSAYLHVAELIVFVVAGFGTLMAVLFEILTLGFDSFYRTLLAWSPEVKDWRGRVLMDEMWKARVEERLGLKRFFGYAEGIIVPIV